MVGLRRSSLAIVVALLLSACGFFSDDPATRALKRVKTLVTMPKAAYQEQRKRLALRERGSVDFLRARIEQNARLTFDVEAMRRPEAKQREVVISVSEKRAARGSHELARYRAQVKQNQRDVWIVTALRLVE